MLTNKNGMLILILFSLLKINITPYEKFFLLINLLR